MWPEVPEDLEAWDHERYHQLVGEAESRALGRRAQGTQGSRLSIGEQAQMLLRGQTMWKSVDPSVRGTGGAVGAGQSL